MGLDDLLEPSSDEPAEERHEPEEPELGPDPPEPDAELDSTPQVDGMLGPTGTPPDLLVGFWSLVLLFNVGLFGLAVGPMLLYFRGDWAFGGALLALGVFATAHGVHRYRRLRRRDELWGD